MGIRTETAKNKLEQYKQFIIKNNYVPSIKNVKEEEEKELGYFWKTQSQANFKTILKFLSKKELKEFKVWREKHLKNPSESAKIDKKYAEEILLYISNKKTHTEYLSNARSWVNTAYLKNKEKRKENLNEKQIEVLDFYVKLGKTPIKLDITLDFYDFIIKHKRLPRQLENNRLNQFYIKVVKRPGNEFKEIFKQFFKYLGKDEDFVDKLYKMKPQHKKNPPKRERK